MAEDSLTAYLEENPRMIGVLSAIPLLLIQAGNVTGVMTTGP
jgi:hypothetical protein